MPLLQSSRLLSIAKFTLATTLLTLSAVAPAAPSAPSALNQVAYAETPATQPPEPKAVFLTENEFYNQNFLLKTELSPENCQQTYKEFPFYVEYIEVIDTGSSGSTSTYEQVKDSTGKLEYEGGSPKQALESEQGFNIQSACLCSQNKKIQPQIPTLVANPTQAQKTAHMKILGVKDWIEEFIQKSGDVCRYFQATSENRIQANNTTLQCTPNQEQAASTQPQKPSVTCTSFCKIDPSVLKQEAWEGDINLTINEFRALDKNNNCEIDFEESCQVELNSAIQACKTGAQKVSPHTLMTDIPCADIGYYSCIKGEVVETNFDNSIKQDQFSTSNIRAEGQRSFINAFTNNDQGAGADNPAINLILYIINLLAGLSFMIAVAMLIIGGFYLVMASGNSEMTDKGKQSIKNFVLAITFTLLSYAIVTIIQAIIYS